MRNPISISTNSNLILFGKKTQVNLKGTVWERIILLYLDMKYNIKGIFGISGYYNLLTKKFNEQN
jgi:hypothetical protein